MDSHTYYAGPHLYRELVNLVNLTNKPYLGLIDCDKSLDKFLSNFSRKCLNTLALYLKINMIIFCLYIKYDKPCINLIEWKYFRFKYVLFI